MPVFRDAPALATPASRFGARLFDQVFTVGAALPGLCVGIVLYNVGLGVEPALGVGAFLAVVGSIAVTSYNWYLITSEGRTLGKRLVGIHIVDADGLAPDFLHGVVLREWVISLIDAFLSLFTGLGVLGIVDAILVFSEGNRTLHDRLAGTRVLRDPSAGGAP